MINKILSKFNLWMFRPFPRPFELLGVKGKELVGVEIGVYKGQHAESLLKNLDIKKLYLIDPYKDYEGYPDTKLHYGKEQDTLEVAKEIAIEKIKWYGRRVKWFFDKSEDCCNLIPNNLDFVYLDGNHTYEYVKKDIEIFYPKVRQGGVFGGHDFFNGSTDEHDGVVNAVLEFIREHPELQLKVETPDWWVVKNKETTL